MKRLWWDDINGRRELSSSLGGIGYGLLIGGFVDASPLLVALALVPLVVSVLIRLHVMAEVRRSFDAR